MKLTNQQLKQIIKEELNKVLSENMRGDYAASDRDMSSLYQLAARLAQKDGMNYLMLFGGPGQERSAQGVASLEKYVNKAKMMVPELKYVIYTELVDYLQRNNIIDADQESGGFSIDRVMTEQSYD